MKKWIVLILLGGFMSPLTGSAIDLKQSKFTQVVNNVEIISAADKTRHTAAVDDIFSMPDVLRTGPNSRAELAAEDGTITRVGANTIFSFDPSSRTIDLQQGSLLFHSPHGKGGGTIRTGSATASVIGTTIIITCTPNGGFKLLDLEGQAEVRYLNGLNQTLEPGQMTFILPGGTQSSPVIIFRLDSETKGSTLVGGFNTPLDSQSKINSEITQQLLQILNGQAVDTGYIVGNNATPNTVQIVQNINNQNNANKPKKTPPPPSAFASDGSIVGSDHVSPLPVNYAPLNPKQVQNAPFTPPAGIQSFSDGLSFLGLTTPASGFVGNNIDIDTANVDLSSFASKSDFDVMAAGNLKIWQSVDFDNGASPAPVVVSESELPDVVSLFAGGQMLIASGSTLEADTETFGLSAGGFGTLDTDTGLADSEYPNSLENITLNNSVGAIQILSISDFTLEDDSAINVGNDGAGLGLEIESEGDLNLGYETTLSEPDCRSYDVSIYSGGDVDLVASGDINIYDTKINTGGERIDALDSAAGGDINITAGGNIEIDDSYLAAYESESQLDLSTPSSAGSVTITGAGVVLDDTYIYGDGDVAVSGVETVGIYDDTTIETGGNATIAASEGGVDMENSAVTADDSVTVSATGDTYIDGSTITVDPNDNVSITDDGTVEINDGDTIYAGGGSVSISSGGTTGIDDSTINLNGNITISGSDTVLAVSPGSGDITISTSGSFSISGSALYVDSSSISGNNIYISDADIETSGNIDIYNHGSFTAFVCGDVDIEDESTINVNNINITDSTITASGDGDNVNIIGDGEFSVYNGGEFYLSEDSTININDVYISSSTVTASGGSVTITAANGVEIDGSYINAGGYESTVSEDAVSILGDDTTVPVTTILSGGNVTISAGGTIGIYDGTTIDAAGDVTITSEGTAISGPEETSSGGDVDIYDSVIYGGDSDFGGSVTVTADNGNVYISDSYISTVEDLYTAVGGIFAGGDINITASGTVDIYGETTIDAATDVNITSTGGDVDIQNDGTGLPGIYAGDSDLGGSITVSADDGNVNISDAYLSASEEGTTGGNVTITAGGNVDIENSTIDADELVSVSADGYVKVHDSQDSPDLSMDYWYVEAGTYVDLSADGNLDISGDSAVYADDGKISIVSDGTVGGSITISGDTTIDASGKVCITDEGTVSLSGIGTSSSEFNIGVDSSDIYSESCNVTMTDGGAEYISEDTVSIEDGTLSANNISISGDSTISASGSVTITDNGTATISGTDVSITDSSDLEVNNIKITGSTITANGGDVKIVNNGYASISGEDTAFIEDSTVSANNITINCSTVTATGGDVDVYDNGVAAGEPNTDDSDDISLNTISISDSALSAYAEGTVGGNVNITGNGTVGIYDDSTIYADNSVNITSDGTVNAAEVDTVSFNGDVDIESSTVTAIDSVTVSATGDTYIDDSTINAGDSSKNVVLSGTVVSGADISGSGGGSISISSGGTSSIIDSDIYLNGNISISGSDTLLSVSSNPGDVTISTGGASLTISGGALYVNDSVISGGNISISDATVTATAGDVNISDYGSFSGSIDGEVDIENDSNVSVNNISITDSDITATGSDGVGGNINILDEGTFYVSNGNGGSAYISDSSTFAVNSVLITDSTISAPEGSVTITAGNVVDIDDSYISDGGYVSTSVQGAVTTTTLVGGDIDITSGGTVAIYDGTTIEAAGNVNITSQGTAISTSQDTSSDGSAVNVYDSQIYADGYVSTSVEGTVTTSSLVGGDINITASGSVRIYDDSTIDAAADVNITSEGTAIVSLEDTSSSSGDVNIENSYVYAGDSDFGGSVNLTADNGNVYISDSYLSASEEGTVGGDVNITASGTVGIYDDTTIYADGNINISAGGDVDISGSKLYFNSESELTLSGQNISQGEDKDISGNAGEITINADGEINLTDSEFHTGGDISISDHTIINVYLGGNVNIATGGDVNLYANNLSISGAEIVGGDISISDSSIATYGGGDIYIGGSGQVFFNDSAYNVGYTAVAGNVSVIDSDINANNGGDVEIDSGETVTVTVDSGYHQIGGNNVTINAGSDVDLNDADIVASGSVLLNRRDLVDFSPAGDVDITAGGAVNMTGGSVSGSSSVNVTASSGITINGTAITSDDTTYGEVNLTSTSGQTTIQNGTSVTAYNLTVNSPDGILLDGTSGGTLSGNQLNLTSGNAGGTDSVTVNNEDLSGYQSVNIAGHTLYLNNDTFNINVPNNFVCWSGTANIDNSSSPSYVIGAANFHNSSTYDGTAKTLIASTSQLNVTGGTTTVNTPGLNIIGMVH